MRCCKCIGGWVFCAVLTSDHLINYTSPINTIFGIHVNQNNPAHMQNMIIGHQTAYDSGRTDDVVMEQTRLQRNTLNV